MAGKSWRDPNWGFPNLDVYPVVSVSYNDMRAFCHWLTEKESKAGRLPEGLEYRLPTETEWEYACRAGSTSAFSCGDDESALVHVAWFKTNSGGRTHPVGQKKPKEALDEAQTRIQQVLKG